MDNQLTIGIRWGVKLICTGLPAASDRPCSISGTANGGRLSEGLEEKKRSWEVVTQTTVTNNWDSVNVRRVG